MSLKEYKKWKPETEEYERKKRMNEHHWRKKEKIKREQTVAWNRHQKLRYETEIFNAKREWMLSIDGVVKGLQYNEHKQFVAQLHYLKKGNILKKQTMAVTDDWVFDTYGKEIAQRIMDQGKHREFITPLDENGNLVMLPMEERNFTRVKYVPQKTTQTEMRGESNKLKFVQKEFGEDCWRTTLFVR
jgi:hypothetical protein